METTRHTCLKLQIHNNKSEPEGSDSIFVKGTWFPARFHLSISDGLNAWTCNASEDEVRERASSWDQPVSEYIELAERYLGFQQPGSVYDFADAGSGHRRLSWTFEREGTKLGWRWKCQPSSDSKKTTANMLDFLMDANIRLSFLGVLNSKKAKLRELQDRLSKQNSGKLPEEDEVEEEESTDKTETFDGETDDGESEGESTKNLASSSKDVPAGRPRGQKRK